MVAEPPPGLGRALRPGCKEEPARLLQSVTHLWRASELALAAERGNSR